MVAEGAEAPLARAGPGTAPVAGLAKLPASVKALVSPLGLLPDAPRCAESARKGAKAKTEATVVASLTTKLFVLDSDEHGPTAEIRLEAGLEPAPLFPPVATRYISVAELQVNVSEKAPVEFVSTGVLSSDEDADCNPDVPTV